MDAVFIAGGESLELKNSQVALLRKLGEMLAPVRLLLRIGPTRGSVIHAFCEGLLSAEVRLAQVLVVLPEGYREEDLDPALLELRATVIPSYKDHDHRNTDEIGDSIRVLGLFGGGKTYTEIVKATDKRKPTVILDGPGEAIRSIRRDPDVLAGVTIVDTPEEVVRFLTHPFQKIAAGA